MPRKDSGEGKGIVAGQIRQRMRNQEWCDFLAEKRNALVLRLRASGALDHQGGYGNVDTGLDGGGELDLAELDDLYLMGGESEGVHLSEQISHPRLQGALPAQKRKGSQPLEELDAAVPPAQEHLSGVSGYSGYTGRDREAASGIDAHEGGYRRQTRDDPGESDRDHPWQGFSSQQGVASAPGHGPAQAQTSSPLPPRAGLSDDFDDTSDDTGEGSSPKYIKGPGGAVFAIPDAVRHLDTSS